MSFETSFNLKQPKLEPKLVSSLSETKCLFRLNRNKQKTNRNSLIGSIFWYFSGNLGFSVFFWFVLVCIEIVCFGCFASIPKQRVLRFRLNRNKQKTNRNSLIESIFWNFYENSGLFWFVSVSFKTVVSVSIVSI